MSNIKNLKEKIDILSFDQYGTIVDIQTGLVESVTPFLAQKGWQGDPQRFVTWWRRMHFENSMIESLCDTGHTLYRVISGNAVSHVMERAGIDFTDEEVDKLVSAIERLRPFPEVPEALNRLGKNYKLAILSNGDRDMLEAAETHIGFSFDVTISVQEAGYYKPHHRTYEVASAILDTAPERILHIANHGFDCIGAKAAGFKTAFINRRNRPFGHTKHQPDITVKNISELADLLT